MNSPLAPTPSPVLASTSTAPLTPSDEKLPFSAKLGYGLGNVANMIGKQAPKQLSLPIYNVALGVDPGSISTVLALARIWDAVTDPFVGDWSDRISTRWGRRRPFIFFGSIFSGLFFASMWFMPHGLSEAGYITYYAVTSFLFYLGLTIYSVPWYALGYEMAKTYDERTSLMAWPSAIGPLAQIMVAWLYAITQLDFFSDTLEGVRWVGAGAGILLVGFGMMPVLLVREVPVAPAPPPAPTTKKIKRGKTEFWRGCAEAFRNRPFLALTIAFTSIMIGSSLGVGLGFYMNTYYIYGGDTKAASVLIGWIGTVSLITTIVFTPVVSKMAKRYGKKNIFVAGIIWAMVRSIAQWFLLTPTAPYLGLVNAALMGIELATIFMLCHAMIADVCDEDEHSHGLRREGLFGALYAWVYKTGLALAFAASGYILVFIGFDRSLGGGQHEGTLLSMKVAFCIVPVVFYLIAFWAMRYYDLTKEKCERLRAEIAIRKQAASASGAA